MPYIGRNLSENYYKIVGRGGRRTNKTRPEVVLWMNQLADLVREHPDHAEFYGNGIEVKLWGRFKDERCPDLNNLHKVIADALEAGLGVNDRHLRFIDKGYTTGHPFPRLDMEIEPL